MVRRRGVDETRVSITPRPTVEQTPSRAQIPNYHLITTRLPPDYHVQVQDVVRHARRAAARFVAYLPQRAILRDGGGLEVQSARAGW